MEEKHHEKSTSRVMCFSLRPQDHFHLQPVPGALKLENARPPRLIFCGSDWLGFRGYGLGAWGLRGLGLRAQGLGLRAHRWGGADRSRHPNVP